MEYTFPAIKTTRTVVEQFSKIFDELKEYEEAIESKSVEEQDKEAIDVLHSVETFLRLRFKGREEVIDSLIKNTIVKNANRGYYDKDCF